MNEQPPHSISIKARTNTVFFSLFFTPTFVISLSPFFCFSRIMPPACVSQLAGSSSPWQTEQMTPQAQMFHQQNPLAIPEILSMIASFASRHTSVSSLRVSNSWRGLSFLRSGPLWTSICERKIRALQLKLSKDTHPLSANSKSEVPTRSTSCTSTTFAHMPIHTSSI